MPILELEIRPKGQIPVSVPTVTVLMAVYNGEKYIRPTILSILNQTFKDFEFVIVDDASTDSTTEIIKSFEDPRIILHSNNDNLGQTKSLNIGLHLARGKYIARTDAGDVSLPRRLEKQVAHLENNPEIAVLGTSAFRYTENGDIIDIVHMPLSRAAMLQRILFTTPVVHVSVVMRRETIHDLGGYDENYRILADYELWSRLLLRKYCLMNLRDILAGYMVSAESFGSKHARGRSFVEACNIIQNNVNALTRLSISQNQAADILKMFSFDMTGMSLAEIVSTENLFFDVSREIQAPKNDINYFLIKRYIKYVLLHLREQKNDLVFQFALRSILLKIGCLFSLSKLLDDMLRIFQGKVWRIKGNCSKSTFSL
jgi:glycosyltransferase involved in cell wall biosynthesis